MFLYQKGEGYAIVGINKDPAIELIYPEFPGLAWALTYRFCSEKSIQEKILHMNHKFVVWPCKGLIYPNFQPKDFHNMSALLELLFVHFVGTNYKKKKKKKKNETFTKKICKN